MLQFSFQGPAKAEHTCRSCKLICWAERLSAFDYTVKHVKGSSNQFADALSRLALSGTNSALPEPTKDITLKRIVAEGITLDKLQSTTKDDPILQQVIPFVNGHGPGKAQLMTDLLPYYQVHGDLHVENGCLARDLHFVIPISLHSEILNQAHLGHPGVARMKWLLRELYWWL